MLCSQSQMFDYFLRAYNHIVIVIAMLQRPGVALDAPLNMFRSPTLTTAGRSHI